MSHGDPYGYGYGRVYSVPASRIRSVLNSEADSRMGADTSPERGVILRIWTGEPDGHPPKAGGGLDSFELQPEDALELAARLVETARTVMVRQVMNS